MIVIIFIIFLKLYRLFSLKPFKHKICFPLKPEIYFPYQVSILVHFRFFTFQEVNLLSSGNRVSVSVEPCLDQVSRIHNMRPGDLVWVQRDVWRVPPDIFNLPNYVRP